MNTIETIIVDFPDGLDKKIDINNPNDKATVVQNSRSLANAYYELIKTTFPSINSQLDDKDYVGYSLMGLACEIYLKHLIYKRTTVAVFITEHKLMSLINLLDSADKKVIVDTLSFQCSMSKSDIEAEIDKFSKAFIAFRYAYELNGYSFNLKVLSALLEILNKISNNN